ncbi:unnamed protein product [Nezara viridula]|uniref:Ubiquitin carboxyl-terminal hydrolase n=1 Tax=Nezara viridula TaxID=85310 RepID=A0A9P0H7M9_NEZVI|nr:unnamed protein product [Nezara viridula]
MPHVCKKISHLFHENENDWGFGNFKLWSEVVDPYNGFEVNDCITIEARIEAEIPHGINWDSKKLTGYIGLKNQGATCYMNSLLQTLFFTNQFRKAVYQIPYKGMESVAFALQRVFYGLQFSDKPVDTRVLTNSFGWKTSDTLRQQDVHEFLRLLIDKLEGMIENTPMKGTLSYLFEGQMVSTIECRYVNYKSSRTETFYDIQLNVVGKENILDSLDEYVAPEILDGDNKYDAGNFGLQKAEKRVVFSKFPPVLYLHLMRFHYDPVRDCSVKCNSRVEFPELLNLDGYMLNPDPSTDIYCLHSVLVHSGNNRDGHYVVYINPELRGNWYIFDDDVVCSCTKQEAINGNFGGETASNDKTEDGARRHFRNAYVLVYIQQSKINSILQTVTESDIPVELLIKLLDKIKLEEMYPKDNTDSVTVQVVLEDSFSTHEGKDLIDPKTTRFVGFSIPKNLILKEFLEGLCEFFKYPLEQMRIWPLNENNRPTFINTENRSIRLQVKNIPGFKNPWKLFLEILPPDLDMSSLPPFDSKKQALIFFKIRLPNINKIIYHGHHYVPISSSADEIMNILNETAGYPRNTGWKIYIEVDNQTLSNVKATRKFVLQNGDVMIFQKLNDNSENGIQLKELCVAITVRLHDVTIPNSSSFIMRTYSNVSFESFLHEVAMKLNTEPNKIQLFLPDKSTGEPGILLELCNFNINDLFEASGEPKTRKIYYKCLNVLTPEDKQSPKRLRESSKEPRKSIVETKNE